MAPEGFPRAAFACFYERHFNERPNLRHGSCYLFVTKTTSGTDASDQVLRPCCAAVSSLEMRDTDAVTRFWKLREQMSAF